MDRAESKGQSWGIPMTMGVLTILLGVIAVWACAVTGVASAIFIGLLLIFTGAFEIVTGFQLRAGGPSALLVLAGLLQVVVGGLFLYRPGAGMASLTLLIACYLFANGLFRGITAAADRYEGWGWDFAYGILAVALGLYVTASWPISSLWVLGTIVGAEIIARGVALVAASRMLRDIEHHVPRSA